MFGIQAEMGESNPRKREREREREREKANEKYYYCDDLIHEYTTYYRTSYITVDNQKCKLKR